MKSSWSMRMWSPTLERRRSRVGTNPQIQPANSRPPRVYVVGAIGLGSRPAAGDALWTTAAHSI